MSVTSANSFALLEGGTSGSGQDTQPKKRRRRKYGSQAAPIYENTDGPGDSQSDISTLEGTLATNGHPTCSSHELAATAKETSHSHRAQQPATETVPPDGIGDAAHTICRATRACMRSTTEVEAEGCIRASAALPVAEAAPPHGTSIGHAATPAGSPRRRRQHQHGGEFYAAHAKGGAADGAGAAAGAAPPDSSFGQYLWAELNPNTATPPSVLRHGLAERQRV